MKSTVFASLRAYEPELKKVCTMEGKAGLVAMIPHQEEEDNGGFVRSIGPDVNALVTLYSTVLLHAMNHGLLPSVLSTAALVGKEAFIRAMGVALSEYARSPFEQGDTDDPSEPI